MAWRRKSGKFEVTGQGNAMAGSMDIWIAAFVAWRSGGVLLMYFMANTRECHKDCRECSTIESWGIVGAFNMPQRPVKNF